MMKRVAIIGGGISGLSAAWRLKKLRRDGADLEYILFEAAPRFGGVLRTERVEGCLVEAGPDSFLTEKPWALQLCRELGLGGDIIGSNDAQRRTFIVLRNRLVELPEGFLFMIPTRILPTVFTPLFSLAAKVRMGREVLCRPRAWASTEDASVAALVERHFGAEVFERLADPLLSGVYGGDARRLSARATLPRLVEMEQKYGSLVRGMLAARRRMPKPENRPPLFSSLKGGMQQLVDALLTRLDPDCLRANTAVEAIAPAGGGWQLGFHAGSVPNPAEKFDAVVCAAPAPAAARLLADGAPKLAGELAAMDYSSSVTASLIFVRKELAGKDRGFGFLVPRGEGRRILACTFVHNKFPHRAPEEKAIARLFLGGTRDEGILTLGDHAMLEIVRRELREIAGITAEPLAARVYRWRRAMAQPAPGHMERLARIATLDRELPGLALAGNYLGGIGVPDCVRSGNDAAGQIAAFLSRNCPK